MNFVFLMDPLQTVNVEKDTSFILMLGAHQKGHKVYYLSDGGMTLIDGRVKFHVTEVIPQQNKDNPFILKEESILQDSDVDVIWIRTDPPFNYNYLMNTWLLDRVSNDVVIINNPAGVRTANEKIWATQFTDIVPKSLVGRNRDDLLAFVNSEKDVIAKPTDAFGGQSIFRIQNGDSNANVILETLSAKFTKEIILQKFIPEAEQGDKRIILLNGEPLGAVLRLHSADDHRNNFFSGGKAVAAKINPRECEIIEVLKPALQKLGLYFVGIDILGDYLIEVNVTSPTCLQEINRFNNQNLQDEVIAFAEDLVSQKKEKSNA